MAGILAMCTRMAIAFTLLGMLGVVGAAQKDDLRKLDGNWLYVEDRTAGRPKDKRQPPMSTKFTLRVDRDAVVMKRGRRAEERMALDGSVTEQAKGATIHRHTGAWKDGTLSYVTAFVRDKTVVTVIRKEFRASPDGLLVRVVTKSPPTNVLSDGIALYKHPKDIALPTPAKAKIADIAWLSGAWVGTRRTSSIEERWCPPLGGAILGVSRTVRRGKMVGFEYLRIVERNGGLVYVAQPGGNPPTEFVLTALDKKRAVFENPRHDSPQRIAYELSDRGLTATTSFINSGPYYRFEFTREGK